MKFPSVRLLIALVVAVCVATCVTAAIAQPPVTTPAAEAVATPANVTAPSAAALVSASSTAPATPPQAAPAPTSASQHAIAPRHKGLRRASPVQAEASPGKIKLAPNQTSNAVRIALVLTLAALIPAVAICMTPFVRIIVVLSMIRHAFGMPETPPNQVLISLALFLTAFAMMPTFTAVSTDALQPFLKGNISVEQAMDRGSTPLRAFMLRQVRDRDIKTIYDIAKQPLPAKASDVGLMQLTSAFMLNELRVSFKIGFVILLPFLLIDIVVSSILLSLGMLMVPPSTLSLPIKVLMFVLIDGWSLVLQGVVGSFR